MGWLLMSLGVCAGLRLWQQRQQLLQQVSVEGVTRAIKEPDQPTREARRVLMWVMCEGTGLTRLDQVVVVVEVVVVVVGGLGGLR